MRRPRVDAAARQREELGPARARLARDPQIATRVDGDPEPRLRQREHRVVGRDPHIGHQRQLEADAEAVALYGRDDGLRQAG